MTCAWTATCEHDAVAIAHITLISPAVGNNGHGPAGRPLAADEVDIRTPICGVHRNVVDKFWKPRPSAASGG